LWDAAGKVRSQERDVVVRRKTGDIGSSSSTQVFVDDSGRRRRWVRLAKYFVMEDDCEDCITEWGADHRPHVDLWMAATGATLPACEAALTPAAPVPLEIKPPADRPVDLRPLDDPTSGRCWSAGP
jgi:hypothetical protein